MYLSGYQVPLRFGVGTMHNGDRYIIGNAKEATWAELIRGRRAGPLRVHLERHVGRLMRAEGSNGDVRSYGYGARDEMLTVHEPGRSVENTFDANGRVVRQVATLSDPSFGGVGTYV